MGSISFCDDHERLLGIEVCTYSLRYCFDKEANPREWKKIQADNPSSGHMTGSTDTTTLQFTHESTHH